MEVKYEVWMKVYGSDSSALHSIHEDQKQANYTALKLYGEDASLSVLIDKVVRTRELTIGSFV